MTEAAAMASDEQTEPRRCRGTTQAGQPCGVGPELLMQAEDGSWWCFGHSPSVRPEARRLAGALGGLKIGARMRKGLDPDELGQLATPEDAMRISALMARSVATGALSAEQGKTVAALVQQWLRAYAQNVTAQQIVEAWRAQKGEGR